MKIQRKLVQLFLVVLFMGLGSCKEEVKPMTEDQLIAKAKEIANV